MQAETHGKQTLGNIGHLVSEGGRPGIKVLKILENYWKMLPPSPNFVGWGSFASEGNRGDGELIFLLVSGYLLSSRNSE